MNAIEVKGLTKSFGELVAVDHLTFSVGEGELFALLGVNGAGKTTAIRLLTCLSRADAGEAYLAGHSVTDEEQAVKALSNVSPQETAVATRLSVRENLLLIARLYGADKAEAERRTDAMIERMEKEAGPAATLVMTGGNGDAILPHCKRDILYDENLILDGLYYLYQKNHQDRRRKKNAE
jgi:ABC-type multidrug transport system ATPase subunit